jgi:putative hydrolase of the HAD superfamily
MSIEALMVDVDGVVIVHPDPRGWSANLERDLGVSPARLQDAFFRPHFADVIHGRAGLRDRLQPVLAQIAPSLGVETLIAYWFEQDAHLDHVLLEDLAEVRRRGVAVHLATVQEHERARYIWETLALRDRFDAIHYAADMGCAKPAPAFFAEIEARTGLSGPQIAFIDDKSANVEAARARHWRAELWEGRAALRDLLPDLFSSGPAVG